MSYGDNTIGVIRLGMNKVLDGWTAGSLSTTTVDASTDIGSFNIVCPKAMTIDQIGILVNTKTGTPTYTVSLQAMDANGDPDGTVLGGGSPASTQWAVGTNNVINWITLDNSYTCTRGELLCIVWEDGSTPNISGSQYFKAKNWVPHGFGGEHLFYPSLSVNSGSSFTKTAQGAIPVFGLRNSGTLTDVMGLPVITNSTLVAVTETNDIVGQKFKLPTSYGTSVGVHGIDLGLCYIPGQNHKIGIWADDGTPTEIVSVTIDKDQKASDTQTNLVGVFTEASLNTDTTYYVGIQVLVGNYSGMYCADAVDDNSLSAFSGYPNNSISTFLAAGSAWVDDAGWITHGVNLLVSSWTAGGGAGGGGCKLAGSGGGMAG